MKVICGFLLRLIFDCTFLDGIVKIFVKVFFLYL